VVLPVENFAANGEHGLNCLCQPRGQPQGNAALSFPIPSSGSNPNISATFTLNSSGASACPLTSGGSVTVGTLAAGASCQLPVSFVPAAGGALSGSLVVTDSNLNAAAPGYTTQSILLSGTGVQTTPSIIWAKPAAITYGTMLSGTQLNATATVPGTFTYSPAAGTLLAAGQQTLAVTFTPTDTIHYTSATASVTLTVKKAALTIFWANPAVISYGTALSNAQLNASSMAVGSFAYSPTAGTVLSVGKHTLSVILTPADPSNYTTATATTTTMLTVNKAAPLITWATPVAITYGTALSATQLNASSSTAGTFIYSPAAGKVLAAGQQILKGTFTPTDTNDYTIATATVTLTVSQEIPSIAWTPPAAIAYGTALSARQLNASSSVGGTFTYSPAAGTVLGVGQQTLTVSFSPNNSTDYTTATDEVTLTVNMGTTTIKLTSSASSAPSGASVTFTATVTGGGVEPTGRVTFVDGSTQLGTGILNSSGVATFAATNLAVGRHSVTANYSGDGNYLAVTSTAVNVTITR
jgi:hypothetical protein